MKRLKQLGLGVLRKKDKKKPIPSGWCNEKLPFPFSLDIPEGVSQDMKSLQRIKGLSRSIGKGVSRNVRFIKNPDDPSRLK